MPTNLRNLLHDDDDIESRYIKFLNRKRAFSINANQFKKSYDLTMEEMNNDFEEMLSEMESKVKEKDDINEMLYQTIKSRNEIILQLQEEKTVAQAVAESLTDKNKKLESELIATKAEIEATKKELIEEKCKNWLHTQKAVKQEDIKTKQNLRPERNVAHLKNSLAHKEYERKKKDERSFNQTNNAKSSNVKVCRELETGQLIEVVMENPGVQTRTRDQTETTIEMENESSATLNEDIRVPREYCKHEYCMHMRMSAAEEGESVETLEEDFKVPIDVTTHAFSKDRPYYETDKNPPPQQMPERMGPKPIEMNSQRDPAPRNKYAKDKHITEPPQKKGRFTRRPIKPSASHWEFPDHDSVHADRSSIGRSSRRTSNTKDGYVVIKGRKHQIDQKGLVFLGFPFPN